MQSIEKLLTSLIIAGCMLINISAKVVTTNFCDDLDAGLYPDPESCGFYYSCANQITYRMPCPASLIFDPSISVCNWPTAVSNERKVECSRIASTKSPSSTPKPTKSTTTTTTTTTPTTTHRPLIPVSLPNIPNLPKINMPRSLQMRFNMGPKSVTLDITQKPETSPKVPKMIVAERGRITEWESDETYALYEGKNKTASMVVSTNGKNGKDLTYHGSFTMDGKRYSLKPKGAMNISPASSNDMPMTFNGTKYTVAEEDSLPPTCDGPRGARDSSDSNTTTPSPTLQEVVVMSDTPPVSRSTKQHLGVELLAAIDYATYLKFYMQSTATTDQGRKADAFSNIRYYFFQVVNGIDIRYSSVNESDFDMYVRLAGYYIATTPYDSPWTEGYGIKSSDGYTDAGLALTSFEKWMKDNAAILPTFDSAAIFSSNRLYYGTRSDGSKATISGLGEIEASCTYRKVAINYEFGLYSTIETAAHELGHNLGAQHDTPDYNGCNSQQQYVMASYPLPLTNDTLLNPYRFSQCSVDYFRRYMTALNNQNNNCLLNDANWVEPNEADAFLRTWPGQKYKPDQQCQLLYGQTSYYCAGGTRDRSICREMKCWDQSTSACVATVEQRAFDGTTCASGSWCYKGDCVANDMAPSAPQSCIYGDYRGKYYYNGQYYTCQQIGDYYPFLCYDSGYSGDCCTTCSAKKTQNLGCEYGDREPEWCRTTLRSFDCYDSTVRTRCCSTCSRYYRNQTGCEYGDRDNSWCPNISSQQCYSSGVTCCSSCQRFSMNLQGCEYGDKVTGCNTQTQYCQTEPSIADSCCGTCNYYYPRSTTTTTTMKTTTTTTTTAAPITPKIPTPPSTSTCPLGDGAGYCATMSISNCYGYSGVCCETCPKHYDATRQGCEYGDKVDWCKTYVQGPKECNDPTVNAYCCETCPKYLSGYLEPVCANKADWCSTISSGACYDPATQDTCCVTCKAFKNQINRSTCPYGDKFTWCASQYCDQNRAECCVSCQ